ncbi:hypothetical protein D9619_004072 [Psilocybe cf. subviscida]|uniref:RNase H type-1 domain-containing protein n=1 Tax=Psilocybe cf. subviscida TaxID=2480587 RepID=A0A8H5BS87_9AGAR|nr:hypothetical protein D9619_004072 [Psilocybe cf. subviscida]
MSETPAEIPITQKPKNQREAKKARQGKSGEQEETEEAVEEGEEEEDEEESESESEDEDTPRKARKSSKKNTYTEAPPLRYEDMNQRRLRILQINLNKSPTAHWELLNVTARGFCQVYPGSKIQETKPVRSGIWMNEALSTNSWRALEIEDSADVTAVQLKGEYGQITIFNIYNDCNNDDTLTALDDYLDANYNSLHGDGKYVMWAGDFNRHHPDWDHEDDHRLFTTANLEKAQPLRELVDEHGMEMALPQGIRTLTHNVSKNESRPDNVFVSENMANLLISCTVSAERHVKTDHYGIETILNIEKTPAELPPVKNWRMVDWKEFTIVLQRSIEDAGLSTGPIHTEEYFTRRTESLIKCLQETIEKVVPESRPSSYARKWWNRDLDTMRKRKKELSKTAKANRALPDHPIHSQLQRHLNNYSKAIEKAKVDHWEEFLTNASTADMWIANGYLKSPVGDAGRPRIPSLKATALDSTASTVDTNEKKAELLAASFFPKKPANIAEANEIPEAYPTPLPGITKITEKIVKRHLLTLSPYKAPGLDAAISKTHKWVMLFKRLARTARGLNGALMRHLYRAVGLPKLTYAADIWYEPLHIKPNNQKRTGSVQALQQLQQIQRQAAIAITGALKSTARDMLDAHANLTPIEIYMESLYCRAYICISTLPANHILNMQAHAARATRHIIKKQLSPLQQMAQRYPKINPDQIEKIGHEKRPVSFTPVFVTDIAATRQESINIENNDKARYKIYTDGSGMEGQVGAAALLFEDDHTEPIATRHYHLGPASQYTTYDAEWVGILLAVWLLTTAINQARIGISNIRIYADNQSVIQTLEKGKPGPAQHIADAVQDIAETTRNKGPRIKKFDIRWISAHSDVTRNEKVDIEAKAAAHGTTSEDQDLPPMLQRTLPTSKSALVQAAKSNAKEQWRIAWTGSSRISQFCARMDSNHRGNLVQWGL